MMTAAKCTAAGDMYPTVNNIYTRIPVLTAGTYVLGNVCKPVYVQVLPCIVGIPARTQRMSV